MVDNIGSEKVLGNRDTEDPAPFSCKRYAQGDNIGASKECKNVTLKG